MYYQIKIKIKKTDIGIEMTIEKRNCSVDNYRELLSEIPSTQEEELIHIIEYCVRHFLSTKPESLGHGIAKEFATSGIAPENFIKTHSGLDG
jgi:hypothetical protein